MHFSRAIHFTECLSRYFSLYFSTWDEFRDIFDVFFDTSEASVEKYVENVEKFVECREKSVANIETNTRESEWPG